jgi:glycosyltransferase involved in cell wall biosynthesis
MKSKILVFIPTYRCESQITRVIKQFDDQVQEWIDTVIIVDNGSPDGTVEAAIECGKEVLVNCNFIAMRNNQNYGLGGSHKAAFRYAIDNDFEYLVVLHGDDQGDIKDLIPQLKAGTHLHTDCLLGARFMQGSTLSGYSKFRTFGNKVYNTLFSFVVHKKILDLGSGLNLYRLSALTDFYYKTFPDDLTFNYVMLLASYHRKQEVRFFPITWREDDQISNVRMLRQAFKVLRLLAGYGFRKHHFLTSELRSKSFDSYTSKILYRHSSRIG